MDRKRIIVGVSGGIAAYKACTVVRQLAEAGHEVRVIPTESALRFVGAATFEALSGQPVHTGVFSDVAEVPHVRLGQQADLVVVAPATADLLARAVHGRADDLLTRAQARQDDALLLQAHHCQWASHFNAGDFAGSATHIDQGLRIYAAGDYVSHASLYGNHDAKVCAHGNRAQAYWMQGKIGTALAEETRSVEWARKLAHLGSVIHSIGGEQNIWKMGGLRKHLPRTYWSFLAACLAIAAIPPFSGFYSKEAILWEAYVSPRGGTASRRARSPRKSPRTGSDRSTARSARAARPGGGRDAARCRSATPAWRSRISGSAPPR